MLMTGSQTRGRRRTRDGGGETDERAGIHTSGDGERRERCYIRVTIPDYAPELKNNVCMSPRYWMPDCQCCGQSIAFVPKHGKPRKSKMRRLCHHHNAFCMCMAILHHQTSRPTTQRITHSLFFFNLPPLPTLPPTTPPPIPPQPPYCCLASVSSFA